MGCCSAEDHVDYVFSNRLSGRSKRWSMVSVAKLSKFIIYKKSGGKIVDLAWLNYAALSFCKSFILML